MSNNQKQVWYLKASAVEFVEPAQKRFHKASYRRRPALTEATSTTARGGTPGSDPEKRHAMLSFRMGRTEFLQCSKRFSVICREPGRKCQ